MRLRKLTFFFPLFSLFLLLFASCGGGLGEKNAAAPSVSETGSSARPTGGAEEIVSYVIRPDRLTITESGGTLSVSAPIGTIVTPQEGKNPS